MSRNKCVARIKSAKMDVLSGAEAKRQSVVEISQTTLYKNMLPNHGSVNDHIMGSADKRLLCGTCGSNIGPTGCQGHNGSITFDVPIINPNFIKQLLTVLRYVCHCCGEIHTTRDTSQYNNNEDSITPQATRLLNNTNNIETETFDVVDHLDDIDNTNAREYRRTTPNNTLTSVVSFAALTKITPSKKCYKCGFIRPKISIVTKNMFDLKRIFPKPSNKVVYTDEDMVIVDQQFNTCTIRSLLESIPQSSLSRIGLTNARPEEWLLTCLTVPSPIIRPAVRCDETPTKRGQDDLTKGLQSILKANIKLNKIITKNKWQPGSSLTPKALEQCVKLQGEVSQYMLGKGAASTGYGSGGDQNASITSRLTGKTGRIRGNLTGKRTDFSSRTVITPDASIDAHEMGLPISIAMILTVPVIVTSANHKAMMKRVINGSNIYPGACFVTLPNGKEINLLCEQRDTIQLPLGSTVHRHVKNGDVLIFNRQPTLHRHGMGGHSVVIMHGNTIRMSLSNTSPYNADFDGDEINCHLIQSTAAMVEVTHAMFMTNYQNKNGKDSDMASALVQDAMVGANMLTDPTTFIDFYHANMLVSKIRYPIPSKTLLPQPTVAPLQSKDDTNINNYTTINHHKNRDKTWTGRQIASMMLPTGLNVKIDSIDNPFIIKGGQLICGTYNKRVLNKVILAIHQDYGHVASNQFISDMQRVCNRHVLDVGLSVSIGDCVISSLGEELVDQDINTSLEHIDSVINQSVSMSSSLGPTVHYHKQVDKFDRDVETAISKLSTASMLRCGGIAINHMCRVNSGLQRMVNCGSKGSQVNLGQIMACIGLQMVDGKRVLPDAGQTRTLSCFKHGDKSMEAHGGVYNSFLSGLSPTEYYYHAMAGRVGLIDTAVKTAMTGHMTRILVKGLDCAIVQTDGTVRMGNRILDYSYGGTGMDPAMLEYVSSTLIHSNNNELFDLCVETHLDLDVYTQHFVNGDTFGSVDCVPPHGDCGRDSVGFAEYTVLKRLRDSLRRQIEGYPILSEERNNIKRCPLPYSPERLLQNAICRFPCDTTNNRRATRLEIVSVIENALTVCDGESGQSSIKTLCAYTLHAMTSKNVHAQQLSIDGLKHIWYWITSSFRSAMIDPGSTVGVAAAHAIGEPCLQKQLNTFHFCGQGVFGEVSGIARVRELCHLSPEPKAPCMILHPIDVLSTNKQVVDALASSLKCLYLESIVTSIDVVPVPNKLSPHDTEQYHTNVDDWALTVHDEIFNTDKSEYTTITNTNDGTNTNDSGNDFWIQFNLEKLIMREHNMVPLDVWYIIQHVMDTSFKKLIKTKVASSPPLLSKPWHTECILPHIIGSVVDDCWTIKINFNYLYKDIFSNDRTRQVDVLRFATSLLTNIKINGINQILRTQSLPINVNDGYDDITGNALRNDNDYRYCIVTEGSRLQTVTSLPQINSNLSTTNVIDDAYQVYGIEGMGKVLLNELVKTMTGDGTVITTCHMSLIVLRMCVSGIPTSLSRYGTNREVYAPFARSSYEETIRVLTQGAVFGMVDDLKGVTQCAMFGKPCPIGPGAVMIEGKPHQHNNMMDSKLGMSHHQVESIYRLNLESGLESTNHNVVTSHVPLSQHSEGFASKKVLVYINPKMGLGKLIMEGLKINQQTTAAHTSCDRNVNNKSRNYNYLIRPMSPTFD